MNETIDYRKKHIPVLFGELIENTHIFSDKKNIIVDCTLGMGGHASKILENLHKWDIFIGFDADLQNLEIAKKRLEVENNNGVELHFIHENFSRLKQALKNIGIEAITAIYYDLGISSVHLDEAERGFSFMNDGPLDMRLDKTKGITAKQVVNGYTQQQLREIFLKYGEESKANLIAKKIVETRRKQRFETTTQLSEVVGFWPKVKSKIFQAIRIEVNNELKNIETSLHDAIQLLEKNGSIFVISFHSLEDRIVKHLFRQESKNCICDDIICSCKHKKQLKILTKKPILPTEKEVSENIRSRSAKARAAIKI